MIRVITHQSGQVEGNRKPGLALSEKIAVTAVGFFRRGKTGKLAHGPEPASIPVLVDAAGIGELAGCGDIDGSGIRTVDRIYGDSAERFELPGRRYWHIVTPIRSYQAACASGRS